MAVNQSKWKLREVALLPKDTEMAGSMGGSGELGWLVNSVDGYRRELLN